MATYTYSGDPASSPKDAVRFLAKATGEDAETGFVTDEEIQWILGQEPNVYMAAARVAESAATFFGSKQDKTVGPLSISYRNQTASYGDLAAKLRSQANSTSRNVGPISTGATSQIFGIGMNDNPQAGNTPPWEDLAPWCPQ